MTTLADFETVFISVRIQPAGYLIPFAADVCFFEYRAAVPDTYV